MLTPTQLTNLKKQFGHIFVIEDNGNFILKDHFGIPPFKMIYVEGGEFQMGKGEDEHKVKLSPFYMAEYSVTQEIYKAVTNEKNPSRFEGLNHPVEQVSWYNAVEFCEILNKKIGISESFYSIDKVNKDKNNQKKDDELKWTIQFNKQKHGFRLPTEAEWEFAAKGGAWTVPTNANSDTEHLDEVSWYNENNDYETKPVGLKFPNSLGIYDISGNVWEWCWDWHGGYDKNEAENPLGAESGSGRVVRGGAWFYYADACQVMHRSLMNPSEPDFSFGFRLIFTLRFM